MGPIIGIVCAVLFLGGGVMFYVIHKHGVELREQQAAMQAKAEADRRTLVAQQEEDQRKLREELSGLQAQLDKASNDAERAKIRQQMLAAQATHRAAGAKKVAGSTEVKKTNVKTNDPLGGLDGL